MAISSSRDVAASSLKEAAQKAIGLAQVLASWKSWSDWMGAALRGRHYRLMSVVKLCMLLAAAMVVVEELATDDACLALDD